MKKIIAIQLVVMMVLSMTACSGRKTEAKGVYYLNFKLEADAAWQALANRIANFTTLYRRA